MARHHFSIQRKFKSSSSKYILHLKNISCSMLVRKHALSALQPKIAIIAGLYHMGEKLTITIKRGEENPKPRTFLHSGKVQTVRTRLRAPVEMSDKYRQLLKRGGRCCVCLRRNQTTECLTGSGSTRFDADSKGLPPKLLHPKLLDVHH